MQSDDDGFFNTVNEEAEADSSDSEGDVEDSEEEEEVPGSEEENDENDDDDDDDLGGENAEDLLSEEEDFSDLEGEDADSEDEAEISDDESEDNVEESENQPSDSSLVKTKNDQTATNKVDRKTKTKNLVASNKQQSTSTDSGLDKTKDDEYADYDTSDEEDIRNTVGNIPMNWYDEYKHLGYDWDGKPIGKPESGDHLDNFLKRMEDPDFWRTVKDPQTGQDVVLSEEDIQTIQRLKAGKIPDVTFDEYAVRILLFLK